MAEDSVAKKPSGKEMFLRHLVVEEVEETVEEDGERAPIPCHAMPGSINHDRSVCLATITLTRSVKTWP